MAGIATRAYAFARSLFGVPVATISVAEGGDLQAALNAAQPGDVIELEAGARFIGQYTFPAKMGRVTLRTAGTLPDRRITPADAALLATIASPFAAMAVNLYDSTNWTLDGLRFEANVGGAGEVIGLQNAGAIILSRLLIDLPDQQQQKRFILGNGQAITLTQSHIAGIWRDGQDSQCFCAWDGAGPYTLTDNYLEAAGENVMFGGADALSADRMPADILIENNLFTKRLIWKGQPRGVKNLFELKAARRVTVRGNVFEHNWIDAQSGRAIVFTPRNQDGNAPWSTIDNVLFENNIVRDVPVAFSVTGYDGGSTTANASLQSSRITIRDNAIRTTSGQAFLLMDEIGELSITGNTITVPDGEAMMTLAAGEGVITPAGTPTRKSVYAVIDFTFAGNTYNGYIHSARALGEDALKAYCVEYTLTTEPTVPPVVTPPDPIVLTDRDRIEESLLLLQPMEKALTGKALSNLRNIVTRLQTLLGQVK